MEMPDRLADFDAADGPIVLPNSKKSVPRPALSQLYLSRANAGLPADPNGPTGAYLLYLIVSMGSPEAMEQFSQSEIGVDPLDAPNQWPFFIDGWGRPISFLRWAPGFSQYSDVQSGNKITDHDPFDPQNADPDAYRLVPLIYSDGSNSNTSQGININTGYSYSAAKGVMFTNPDFQKIGTLIGGITSYGGITNHHIEAR
jgi:hypothetical protein